VTYPLLNATVLFLGISIAALWIGRVALNAIKATATRGLTGLEEDTRRQASLAAIASVLYNHAQAAGTAAKGVVPLNIESTHGHAVQRNARPRAMENVQSANQTCWRPVRMRAAGYTLIELLTSLSVVAILAWVSVPQLASLMLDTRVKTTAFDVYTTMVYARSEAIKRNTNVDVIPTGGNWKNGWTVQAGVTVLKTVAPSTSGLDDITNPATLTYGGDGRLTNPGTVTYVLGISANPQVTARRVIVDTSGRPTLRQGLL
jgi:type IV fimbrial biogenesis protein FimT